MNLQDKFTQVFALKGEEMKLELSKLTPEESKYINARMVVMSLEQKTSDWKKLITEMELSQDIVEN